MITKTFYAGITTIAAIAGGTVAVETRYEKQAAAETHYQQIAGEQESDRIRTQLQILEIRLQKYKELAAVRPLTEAEQIDLRSLEQERAALLTRLAAKG